jgi:O-antigen biosynthesis protein
MVDGNIRKSELPGNELTPVATPPGSEYNSEYYDAYGRLGPSTYTRENPHWLKFFGRVADSLIQQLHPQTTLDVGCAKGFLVECLRDREVEAYGFDVSEYAIREVRDDIRPYCSVGSASNSITKDYDLITCIEVCEHLPEFEAQETIRQMTLHTDIILFSSTPTNFEEPTHINVHPIIDWLRIFAQYSFGPDQDFDTREIAPQAMLLRRVTERPSDQALCQFANLKNQEIARSEMKGSPEYMALQTELEMMRNSKGWRLLNRFRSLRSRLERPFVKRRGQHLDYDHWIEQVERRSYNPARIQTEIAKFNYKTTISIVMPVYNTPVDILNLTIRSVVKQHYKNWELCICDDASSNADVRQCLENWQKQDERIKISFSQKNEGISAASNRALQLASGEFVGLLDHDDELSLDALYEVVKLLQEHREADMIYSDEDKLDSMGHRVLPFFKPDWSPEYMLSCMYTCHFGVYRKRLVDEIGGFRTGFDGGQDYDLVLRLSEKTKQIFHIPKILYHWRMVAGSAAASLEAKPYALAAAKRALTEHLERRQLSAEVTDANWPSHYKIRFRVRDTETVSIVIVASGKANVLRASVGSIEEKSRHAGYEIIAAITQNAQGGGEEIRRWLAARRHQATFYEGVVESSRLINLGVKQAKGEYVVLLSDETEVISQDWIASMLGLCRQRDIGVVGAKLLYKNNLIEHAGIVLGLKGVAGRPLRNFPRNTRHGFEMACDTRNCSAVSAACMMVRKAVFEQVGGFDEGLSADYNDLDFCLKVRNAGYRIVWTPWAELYHGDPQPAVGEKNSSEAARLKERWGKILTNDPYYNPNLTLEHEDLGYRIRGYDGAR